MDFILFLETSNPSTAFLVLTFHGFTYLKTRDKGSGTIILGVGIASIAALIFMNEISPNIWFNHIDLSHVIMAIAAQLFYKGALTLNKRTISQS